MYNPTANWGQRETDLTASAIVNYFQFSTKTEYYNEIRYKNNGLPYTQSVVNGGFNTYNSGSGKLLTLTQDIINNYSFYPNSTCTGPQIACPDAGPWFSSQPYFGTAPGPGTSSFSVLPEAWYVDVTFDDTSGFTGSFYFNYINVDGELITDSVSAITPTKRILSQTAAFGIITNNGGLFANGNDINWNIVSRYYGNITPYPNKNIPVDYFISSSLTSGQIEKYYYEPTGSLIGSGSVWTGSLSAGQSVKLTSYNVPVPVDNYFCYIASSSVVPPFIYSLQSCTNSAISYSATLSTPGYYFISTSVNISSSTINGCFNIKEITTSGTPTYSNLNVLSTYATCFDCNWTSSILPIDYIVVAGGGGGGNYSGGGAGGVLTGSLSVSSSNYTITVGLGGSGSVGSTTGTNGQSSSLIGTPLSITATGGGYGGNTGAAGNGGSGGGGRGAAGSTGGTGIAGQGNNGAAGSAGVGGAGGGAGAAGSGRNGGNGIQWLDSNYYGGGGAAGFPAGTPGLGGGGATSGTAPSPGTANTGGGGGGWCCPTLGGAGGSGVVIIRYPGSTKATGGTITFSNGYTYHTFTTNGTFTY